MSKKNKDFNENYTHCCDCKKVSIKQFQGSFIGESIESKKEFAEIIDFYIFKAPILKDSKNENDFGLTSLSKLGWHGNGGLGRLESELKSKANITLYFIRSDRINNTVSAMNLDDNICIEHARGVLKQNYSITVKENGEKILSNSESRMLCLFRHIRNSLAHGRTYTFDNGYILLDDIEGNGILSARLLIKLSDLHEWIYIILNPPTDLYMKK